MEAWPLFYSLTVMPTTSHRSLFQIFRHSQRQFLLQFVLFCCSTITVLGGYRSNPVFVTIFGVLTAVITFVAALVQVLRAENRPPSHDRDIETRLIDDRPSLRVRTLAVVQQAPAATDSDSGATAHDRNTSSVPTVHVRTPENTTVIHRVPTVTKVQATRSQEVNHCRCPLSRYTLRSHVKACSQYYLCPTGRVVIRTNERPR
ncbi:uncharacterized protein EV420DRAFT_426963 [Desarmillaria tabescens]|uniref:Uncharacterized protein n=1 Tax=Armillaria tabescens TaxID=1929756 RepID=A0AA39NLB8_ARMTA|nr:uncharacterized protein EV420DRAFT_426963 [Desarmillaria tabescens]KAK0467755.1 hypothetical protein EV420DRAFT_426963 [Desarmillaria tabescens]